MDKDETELNGPSKRIRVAWILIPLCILGAGALTFTTRFKNVTKTKHEFRQAFAAHDWKRLAEILPPIDLQGGTLPPDRFAAFLDQYVGKTEKLVISEKEYVGQTGIEVLYAEGPQVSKGNHNDSQIMEVLVVPDKNRIPFFPPVPRIKYDFTMTYVAV
ncbi:MAG: hypothetical protein WCG75_12760, partial [Armatimonadota bacterium]